MVGGEEEAVERCRPVLAHLGSNVVHVGPSGSGQAVKLCNNMLLAVILAGLAETFVTGTKLGVDAACWPTSSARARAATGCSSTGSRSRPSRTTTGPRFSLDLLYKDASLFGRAADGEGVPVPVAAATEEVLKTARSRGLGALDMTVVVRMYEDLVGARLLGSDELEP